jgi:hypothetical protein
MFKGITLMARKIIGILVVIAVLMASSLTVYAAPTEGAGTVSDTVKSVPEGNADKNTDKNADKNTDKNADKNIDKNADKNADKKTESDLESILNNVIKDGNAINTDQFLVTITKPDVEKLSLSYKSYSITGTTEQKDVRIFLAKYNDNTKEYEAFVNADGESSWDIGGKLSKFSKEIILKDGPNKIKIVAYRTSQEKELKLEDVQVNCFTISYLPVKVTTDPKILLKNAEDSIKSILSPTPKK